MFKKILFIVVFATTLTSVLFALNLSKKEKELTEKDLIEALENSGREYEYIAVEMSVEPKKENVLTLKEAIDMVNAPATKSYVGVDNLVCENPLYNNNLRHECEWDNVGTFTGMRIKGWHGATRNTLLYDFTGHYTAFGRDVWAGQDTYHLVDVQAYNESWIYVWGVGMRLLRLNIGNLETFYITNCAWYGAPPGC